MGRVALGPLLGFSEGHRAVKESIRHPQAPTECWVSIPTLNGFPWTFLSLECSGGGSHDDQAETAKLQGGSASAELG